MKTFQLILGNKIYMEQGAFYPTVLVLLVSVKVWCFNSFAHYTQVIYGKESFHFSDWIVSVDWLSVSSGSNTLKAKLWLNAIYLPKHSWQKNWVLSWRYFKTMLFIVQCLAEAGINNQLNEKIITGQARHVFFIERKLRPLHGFVVSFFSLLYLVTCPR